MSRIVLDDFTLLPLLKNEVTLAALEDMEHSKGKGIHGKSAGAALADLKAEDEE